MTADWNLPTTTSTYTNFLTEFNNKLLSAVMMNLSGDSNIPANAIQYDQSSKRFKLRSGGAWVDLNVHDIIADKSSSATITGTWQYNQTLRMNAGLELLGISAPSAPASGGVMWMSTAKQIGIKTSDGTLYITELDWQSWTPTYSAGSPMTFTSVTTTYGKYIRLWKMCFFILNATGTTGGGAGNVSPDLIFDLPYTLAASTNRQLVAGLVSDGGAYTPIYSYPWSTTQIAIRLMSNANFTQGTGRAFRLIGMYDIV